MRGIRPPALFELRALAECRGLAPHARRHALVSTEARPACPVDIPNLVLAFGATNSRSNHKPADRLTGITSARFQFRQIGPRGRTRTCTVEGLSFVPLHWATRGGAPGQSRTDTARGLSPLPLHWATGANWWRVKDLHPQPSRSERDASSVGLTRRNWHSRQDFRLQPRRSKRRTLII